MNDYDMESIKKRADIGERILHALTQNGLNPLMMLLYSVFNSPVLLADINTRVIFQYPLCEIGDEAYDTLLKDKIMAPHIVEQYLMEYDHNKYDFWKPFYANKGKTAKYPRLYANVRYYGIKQATLAVFLGDKALHEGDLEIIQMFADALEIKLKKDIKGNLDWVPPAAACLQDILETAASPYLKRVAEQTLAESLIGDFALLVTPIGPSERQKNFASYAVSDMMRHYRNLVSIIFDDQVVTLFGELSAQQFQPHKLSFIRQLTENLHQYGLVSGLSSSFSDLSLIPGYYLQARLTAQLAAGRTDIHFLYSEEVAVRLLFQNIANSPSPSIFQHPLLERLRTYDQKNNTVYFQTLKAYCLALFDRDRAAENICVHRNTLVYRLNRLTEIFSVNLEDLDQRTYLYCSFLLENEIDQGPGRTESEKGT